MESTTCVMLDEAKDAIVAKAGSNLRLLFLYGSEARGEATPESDIDILAILTDENPEIEHALDDAIYEVMWKHNFPRLISLQFMSVTTYEDQKRKGYSFIRNVENEGQILWSAA